MGQDIIQKSVKSLQIFIGLEAFDVIKQIYRRQFLTHLMWYSGEYLILRIRDNVHFYIGSYSAQRENNTQIILKLLIHHGVSQGS